MRLDMNKTLLILLAVLTLCACSHTSTLAPFDAVVGAHAHGDNHFSSIQAALDAAPAESQAPYRILLRAGDYYEKLTIDKPHIHLVGEGRQKTRIFYDAYAGQEFAPGQAWGTRGSGTVIVTAPDVQLHHLTVENSFDFIANDRLPKDHPEKQRGSQAVALYLTGNSDRFLARDVQLLGHQDTLFTNAGRAWFDRSIIAGNVDFIFGAGNALFTRSDILTRARGASHSVHGYITAPSTNINQHYGLTFIDCRLLREEGVPDNSTALGRPWHPTTTFADGRYADPDAVGKAVFINNFMDSHILPRGWESMGGTAKTGGRKQFMPDTDARFDEYQSHGPGAIDHSLRTQLTAEQAGQYTPEQILGDWQPEMTQP